MTKGPARRSGRSSSVRVQASAPTSEPRVRLPRSMRSGRPPARLESRRLRGSWSSQPVDAAHQQGDAEHGHDHVRRRPERNPIGVEDPDDGERINEYSPELPAPKAIEQRAQSGPEPEDENGAGPAEIHED